MAVEYSNLNNTGYIELVSQVLIGNRRAENQLYFILSKLVSRVIRKYSAPDDLIHDVVTTIFQKISLFEPKRGTLNQWVYRVAFNQLMDYYRKCKRNNSVEYVDGYNRVEFVSNNHPERIKIDKERAVELRNLLSKLPIEKLELLVDYSEGMSMKELSIKNKKSVAATNSQVFRMKKHLGKILKKGEK